MVVTEDREPEEVDEKLGDFMVFIVILKLSKTDVNLMKKEV